MIKTIIRTVGLGLILGSIPVIGLAKINKKHVTFDGPITVAGTVIKAGSYEVAFDDATGQLTISNGKKVLAQAAARLEKQEGRSKGLYAVRDTSTEAKMLTSVTLKDGFQARLTEAGEMKAEGSQ